MSPRAGVTQRTVFHYFTNKAALVLDVVAFSYFVGLPPEAPSLHDAIRFALDEATARIEEKRDMVVRYTRLIMQSVAQPAAARDLGEHGMRMLRADLARYLGAAEPSARVYVLAEIIYAIGFSARHLWFDESALPVADVMHECFRAANHFSQTVMQTV